jgi:Flp pilus assembly protein TadD
VKNEFDAAIADCTQAIQLNPKDLSTRFDRAQIYEKKGDLDNAVSDLTEIIRLVSKNTPDLNKHAVFARAWLYDKKGELDKSIADYTEVIRLQPHDGYAYCCRAGVFDRKGDLAKAIADYTEAVHLKSDNAYVFIGRARLYAKIGDCDKAIGDCTEAIRLKPDFAAAYNERALAAIRKGNADSAIGDATEAIRLDPKNPTFYQTRSLAHAKKGNPDKATNDLDLAVQLRKTKSTTGQEDASFEIRKNDVGEVVFANPTCSKYVPSIDGGDGFHHFSEAQLKEMVRTPLDRTLFVRYVETKWPLSRLKEYCTDTNRFPKGYQNLVVESLCFHEWQIPLHNGQHEFDKIYVYANEDTGKSNYYGSLATDWRRWVYSLNMFRGRDHWVIIESLPNDFMDNPSKYLPQPATNSK